MRQLLERLREWWAHYKFKRWIEKEKLFFSGKTVPHIRREHHKTYKLDSYTCTLMDTKFELDAALLLNKVNAEKYMADSKNKAIEAWLSTGGVELKEPPKVDGEVPKFTVRKIEDE